MLRKSDFLGFNLTYVTDYLCDLEKLNLPETQLSHIKKMKIKISLYIGVLMSKRGYSGKALGRMPSIQNSNISSNYY